MNRSHSPPAADPLRRSAMSSPSRRVAARTRTIDAHTEGALQREAANEDSTANTQTEARSPVRRRQRSDRGAVAADHSADVAAAALSARATTGGVATAVPSGSGSGTARVRGAKAPPHSLSSLPTSLQLLLQSYPIGGVRSLNGKVGKVAWVGTLPSLPGSTWVALACYRAHGAARRLPVLDFDTVELRRCGDTGVLAPDRTGLQHGAAEGGSIASAQQASAAIAAAEAQRAHVSIAVSSAREHYHPHAAAPEVDLATLVRAQREAAKHFSAAAFDSTVLVRVRVCETAHAAADTATQARSSHPAASATQLSQQQQQQHQQQQQQSTLLPALLSPRSGVGASSSAPKSPRPPGATATATPRRPSGDTPQAQVVPYSANHATGVVAQGSAKKRERRIHAHEAPRARERGIEQPMTQQHSSPEQKESIPSDVAAAAARDSSHTPARSQHIDAETMSPAAAASASTHSVVPPNAPSSKASAAPFPAVAAVESEAHLSSLARQLHLTGPFALVDALALTCPARVAQSGLYTLGRYLSSRFPRVVQGDENRARAILRWIAAHIEWEGSPMLDAVAPEESVQRRRRRRRRSAKGASAAASAEGAAAEGGADGEEEEEEEDEDDDLSDLGSYTPSNETSPAASTRGLVPAAVSEPSDAAHPAQSHMSPPGSPGSAAFTAPTAASLSERARKLAVRELGMGPSARNMRGHAHSASASALAAAGAGAGTAGVHRGQGGRHSSGGGLFSSSSSFVLGLGARAHGGGYSSEEEEASEPFASMPQAQTQAQAQGDPSPVPLTAESVLDCRRSGPLGFALLFRALAAIAGLECVVVRGVVKLGPEYRRRPPVAHGGEAAAGARRHPDALCLPPSTSGRDHTPPTVARAAWNLVRIDGRWCLLDCWGCSGYWDVNDARPGGAFVASFSAAWFAPAPDIFILTHFPLSVFSGSGAEDAAEAGLAQVPRGDPLAMSSLELSRAPLALQMLHPAMSRAAWGAGVCSSRLYAALEVSSLETEYHILYGIDSLGGGVAGATFCVELEAPVWVECAVEMVRMDALDAGAGRVGPARSPRARTTHAAKNTGAVSSAAAPKAHGQGSGAASTLSPRAAGRQHNQHHPRREGDVVDAEEEQCDLSTCWAVQRAVGARLEIRQPTATALALAASPAGATRHSTAATAAATPLQRHKRVVHRARTKVHLVFPHAGHYRIIIHAKTKSDLASSTGAGAGAGAGAGENSPASAAHDAGFAAVAQQWEPLMEYAVTVQQGVADLPRRKAPLKVATNTAHATAAAAAAATAVGATADSTSSLSPPSALDAASGAAAAPPATLAPSTPAAPQLRHVWVGFLQPHLATFSLLSPVRTLAAQIVALRPWSGVWKLSLPLSLQFVTPAQVSEMVLVSDGRWSAMNEGPQGFVDSRYATSQSQLLSLCVHQAAALDLAGGGDKAPRAPGPHRHLYTLDWALLRVPELLVFFKAAGSYHLLSSFRPRNARNFLRDRAGRGRNRRRGELSFDFAADSSTGAGGSSGRSGSNTSGGAAAALESGGSDPPLQSRFFIAPSGAAFDVQLHVQIDSIVVTRRSVSLLADCLRDVLVCARLVEGWADRDSASFAEPPAMLTAAQLQSQQGKTPVRVEEVEDAPPPGHPSLAKALSQMPRSRALHSRGRGGASAVGSATPALDSAQPTTPDDAAPGRNPLHQRLRITAALPATDAISNTSSTRFFTLLLYVSAPEDAHSSSSPVTEEKLLRFAFSYQLWAGDDQTAFPPPPTES